MQNQVQNDPIITSSHLMDLFNRFFFNTLNQESEYSNYTKEWAAFKELLSKEPVDLAQAFQFIANLQQKNEQQQQQKQQQMLHVPEPVLINKAASEPSQRSRGDHYGLGQISDKANLLKTDIEHHTKDLLDPYKTRKVSLEERSLLKKVAIYSEKPDINELQKEIEGLRNQPDANNPSQSKHYLLH